MSGEKPVKGIRKLLRDLKPMTFTEKIDHLWTYYKAYALVALLVVALLLAGITAVVNLSKDTISSCVVANVGMSVPGDSYISNEFYDHLEGKKGQVVDVQYIFFEDITNTKDVEKAYSVAMTAVAMVSGGMLDYMLMDQIALETYIPQDMFLPLDEFFTSEELEVLGDKLIYAQFEEGDPYPVVVDVSELPFIKDNVSADSPVYFAISGSTPRIEVCRTFWEYLLAWEG